MTNGRRSFTFTIVFQSFKSLFLSYSFRGETKIQMEQWLNEQSLVPFVISDSDRHHDRRPIYKKYRLQKKVWPEEVLKAEPKGKNDPSAIYFSFLRKIHRRSFDDRGVWLYFASDRIRRCTLLIHHFDFLSFSTARNVFTKMSAEHFFFLLLDSRQSVGGKYWLILFYEIRIIYNIHLYT